MVDKGKLVRKSPWEKDAPEIFPESAPKPDEPKKPPKK